MMRGKIRKRVRQKNTSAHRIPIEDLHLIAFHHDLAKQVREERAKTPDRRKRD